jgi:hypothetical protein
MGGYEYGVDFDAVAARNLQISSRQLMRKIQR